MDQILELLGNIAEESKTIYEVIVSLENAATDFKVKGDRDRRNLQVIQLVLQLIQKPEQEGTENATNR